MNLEKSHINKGLAGQAGWPAIKTIIVVAG